MPTSFYTDERTPQKRGNFHLEIFDEHDLLQVADIRQKDKTTSIDDHYA